jgi:hypothetical protein
MIRNSRDFAPSTVLRDDLCLLGGVESRLPSPALSSSLYADQVHVEQLPLSTMAINWLVPVLGPVLGSAVSLPSNPHSVLNYEGCASVPRAELWPHVASRGL